MMENSQLTRNFLLWAEKTERLTDEQWAKGFAELERRVERASAENKTAWPPSPSEFVGLCKSTTDAGPNGIYKRFKPALPVPDDIKQKRREKATETCQNLLQLFD
jgi:hypothetical protein